MGQEAKITSVFSLLVLLVLLVCYSRVDLFATASSGHLRASDDPHISSQEAYGRRDGDPGWQRAAEEKEGLAAARAPPAALGRSLDSFPSASDATIMFLHVFKCAGTSLREVFMALAEEKGWSRAVVEECTRRKSPRRLGAGPALTESHVICLNDQNTLRDSASQRWEVAGTRVLAGHFLWDLRQYVTPPHLLITMLRDPLELFVSAKQFKHREKTASLEAAADFVASNMRGRLGWEDPSDIGFVRRFLDADAANSYDPQLVYTQEQSSAMTSTAVEHLSNFWVVGVVEQYAGFVKVLQHTLDPESEHPRLWEAASEVDNNGSPVHSRDVLDRIDPDLVREFNATLSFQWQMISANYSSASPTIGVPDWEKTLLPAWCRLMLLSSRDSNELVYDVALQLWDSRCREVLPLQHHSSLCSVPGH